MRSGRERARERKHRESREEIGPRVSGVGICRGYFHDSESSVAVSRASVLDGPNRFTGDAPVMVKKVLLITVV
jgi:hypothetical protein